MFTHMFFCPTISKRSKAKMIHTQREKKKQVKKKKKYKDLCPAVTLHKWKKGPTLNTKISQFFISNCLCWLLFRNTLISQGSLSAEAISIFNLLVFSFLITTCSSNCPTHSASLQIRPVLGGAALPDEPAFFFFFHITKLHFYSHIFKF